MHEALLFSPSGDEAVICRLCPRHCRIESGDRGFCGVRENISGTLYANSYGKLTAAGLDPVEKKPLYHYLPGTQTFSVSSYGCNFTCRHCQNYTLSQVRDMFASAVPPEDLIAEVQKTPAKSISFTYNEPTLSFEYALDVLRLAKPAGLGSAFITNGYMSEEALRELAPYLGAIRIDLKAFTDEFYRKVCGAHLAPVLDTILRAKELGLHLELVTLIIPGYNDSPEEIDAMLSWETEHLGTLIPHHFTRFSPMYRMENARPTPKETLDRIFVQAKEHGIAYPYIGNIMHAAGSETRCPTCGERLLLRTGYVTKMPGISAGKCKNCGRPFDGIWYDQGRYLSKKNYANAG
ncbi:MAG: AmmeMemoRadiSam system radical SAM enzyme [Methanocorpusculum sp.]|nr:AmmeMemoRadiSam system radical SAM enzyme [Methanocorpusculum sp.]MDE2523111.1 AmmeMemoRadiSam system radical SAM enzyme [Methanocorpusculum sp.]MDE2525179.1 AmmeMemoRadiSam system radical SAM enzyme [Methanocorpusculum sp.]